MNNYKKEVKVAQSREIIERKRDLDLSLFRKKGNSRTFKGWIIQKMKESRAMKNFDVTELLQTIYKKHLEFETIHKLTLESWKGKSSIQIIDEPNKFIVVTFQKPDKDSKPKEVRTEISREEMNRVIEALNYYKDLPKIHSRQIGEYVYQGLSWDEIFADRQKHIHLNLCLRILDYKELITYRGKYTRINKDVQLKL